MWTAYVSVFIIWLLPVDVESTLLHEYTNGWTPVSSEVVYDQIKRQNTPLPYYITAHNIQLLHTDVNKALPQNILKLPEENVPDAKIREKLIPECVTGDTNCNQAKPTNKPTQESTYEYVPNYFHRSIENNETLRRSKKIADFNSKIYAQELFLPETSSQSKANTYEVTEDVLELNENNPNNKGYSYEPPKKKNQTNALFEILSKYKISKDDELPNYALSLKRKAQNPLKPIPPVKLQNQIVHRYNNLNNLPVDPLLAVFLSNYGFYLRGMYGVNNRYNNLYGYLASNNIHNNGPFGVYKIYSDTDSSH